MAVEREAPDAILVATDLSGVVGDIQDDPDAADANWLTASGNNVNTDVRVSFPTPSGNPRVGADLQEFRALVRQFDEAQTGTPTARLELWENGALIRAGGETNVPDGGVVLSFTWNANELATADGSLVESKVVGTKSGGAPGARNTVEVGAIEWNADLAAATQNITDAGNIGSGEAFGTDQLNLNVSGAGATVSAEAFGNAALSYDQQISAAGDIGSVEGFGLSVLAGPLIPTGIASAEALGNPQLNLNISGQGIGSGEAFGSPMLHQNVAVSGIATAEEFGAAQVNLGLSEAGGIVSLEAFGSPTLTAGGSQQISPGAIGSEEAFGSPSVQLPGSGWTGESSKLHLGIEI